MGSTDEAKVKIAARSGRTEFGRKGAMSEVRVAVEMKMRVEGSKKAREYVPQRRTKVRTVLYKYIVVTRYWNAKFRR